MRSTKGFTLIELLILVLIAGILAAIAIPSYQRAVGQARFSRLKNYTHSLATASRMYQMENGSFPSQPDELAIPFSYSSSDATTPYWSISLNSGEDCIVWTNNENKIACFVTIAGKKIAHYVWTDDGHERCLAFSTNPNDLVNEICAVGSITGTGSCYNAEGYCSYDIAS